MKRHATVLLLLCLAASKLCFSQDSTATTTTSPSKVKTAAHTLQPPVLGLFAGTQGFGGDISFGILKHLAIRAGGGTLPATANNFISFSDLNSNNSLSANFTNAHLLLSFGGSHFRLVGGAAYLIKANGTVNVTPTQSASFGDIVVDKTQIGTATMKVTWSGVAPYLGITVFRAFPRKFFNINLDLGTYYLGTPKTEIIGTGLLQGFQTANQQQFQQNMSGYNWLPVAQINLNFKL